MASNISAPVVQGVFALEVTVTVLAFLLTLLTTTLALLLFLRRSSRHRSNRTSPKGTFAFLFPGALCLTIAQAATAASVALQANSPSPISITHAFSLHHTGSNNKNASRTSTNLSFLSAFASILSTTSLNGAVWLHASHATSNGLAVGQPSRLSIAANTLLLSSMLGTGFASWGLAIAAEKPHERYGSVLQNDTTTAILYTVFRACVVGASASVSVEAVRRFVQVKKHSSRDVSSLLSFSPPPSKFRPPQPASARVFHSLTTWIVYPEIYRPPNAPSSRA